MGGKRGGLTQESGTDIRPVVISPGEKLRTDFSVKAVTGGTVKEMTFNELLASGPRTIVSVYMRNNTGSCDKQVDSLAAQAAEFADLGCRLIALSRDTAGSHLKYAAKKNLPFTLVSDPADLFAKSAGSMIEKSMYGRKFFGPARAAFVLGADGTVLAVLEKVQPAAHADQLTALLATLG